MSTIKQQRGILRGNYESWARSKKAGKEHISGANPTDQQKETVYNKVLRELRLLETLTNGAEELKKYLRTVAKELTRNVSSRRPSGG